MHQDSLPPLRETIAAHGLGAKKGLGQHFLLDLNITRKIVAGLGVSKDNQVIEVGPGPGGLTRALLETGAKVITVERDQRIGPILDELSSAYPGALTQVEADARTVDEATLFESDDHGLIASNLPYNVSTELLVKWLVARPRPWSRMALMFQREVADRILSGPGTKVYGRLSVLAQAMSIPRLGFHLPARAFTPPPKVDSTVLYFDPPEAEITDPHALSKVTAAAFGQRRKMLRSTLKQVFGPITEEVLLSLDLEPSSRAETLAVSDFVRLAALVAAREEDAEPASS